MGFAPKCSATREGRKEGEEGREEEGGPWRSPKPPLAVGTGGRPGAAAGLQFVEEGGAGGGRRPDLAVPERELPRAPWRPALLRTDADAVYPEDRSASAAMDALNVDHHLFGRMPEQ
jgi:hypothetical protein